MPARLIAGFALPLFALILGGCVPLGYKCYDGKFSGIRARVQQAGDTSAVHIVMIHGMTEHQPGYSHAFASGISSRLRLTNNGAASTNFLEPPAPGITNVLRDFVYSRGSTQLFFHELTWSPGTQRLKADAFSTDHQVDARRVWLNKTLKRDVIDDGFGDAVLYLNPSYQANMQQPIHETIRHVVRTAGSNDSIILVASSLGSRMTFDTVEKWTTDEADDFLEKTTAIIMLANQVPLLNLGTVTISNGLPVRQELPLQKFIARSAEQKELKVQRQKRPGVRTEPFTNKVIHVVAATDPNDLLSFPLREADVLPPLSGTNGPQVEVTLANVYSHNGWAIPWLAESPITAHTAYDRNDWLLDKLVRGFNAGSSARRCFTDGPPKRVKTPKAAKHF